VVEKSRKSVKKKGLEETPAKTENLGPTPTEADANAASNTSPIPPVAKEDTPRKAPAPKPTPAQLRDEETTHTKSKVEDILSQTPPRPAELESSEAQTSPEIETESSRPDLYGEEGEEGEPSTISEAQKASIEKWKNEIKLTDEELAYFVNTYPGIEAETITAVKTGKLTESDILRSMEKDLREEENLLTPEQGKELEKLETDMKGVAQAVYGDEDSLQFSDEELAELGLSRADMDVLLSGDMSGMTTERALKVTEAMKRIGITENDIRGMVEETGEEDEENQDTDKRLASAIDDEQSMDPELKAFLKNPAAAGLSEHDTELFKRALKGDGTAIEDMMNSLTQEERAEFEALDQTDSEGLQGDSPALHQMMEKLAPHERAEFQALLLKDNDESASNGVEAIKSRKPLTPDEWMAELEADGISPEKLGQEEFMLAMEKKLSQDPSFKETRDGDSIRVHHVGSKDELASVRQRIAQRSEEEDDEAEEREYAKKLSRIQNLSDLIMEQEVAEKKERGPKEPIEQYLGRHMDIKNPSGPAEFAPGREKPGFFNYGEVNRDVGEDEEFEGDDLSAAGHAEVDQHRELREYARLAAWELPLLNSTLLSLSTIILDVRN
jgi:hypothetical protein